MRVLLDTNILILAYESGIAKMPKMVQRILADTETERVLSSISLTEIAIKMILARKLLFPLAEIYRAMEDMRLTVISYSALHADAFFSLPFFEDHRDPFDRMLIATAMSENIPLISSDKHFKRYKGLQVIWK